tara:strand:+ start:412 stop:627 length:216 start_codon:yes stop_codon:yes gene_type:complete
MKKVLKQYWYIISITAAILLVALLTFSAKESPLDNIEKRLDEASEKESVLTDNEKKLKQESQTKEWEEIDK